MDLLTIILFVPFCLVVLAGTGLALVVAIDLDRPETARTGETTRPRIRRYIVLPPVTPAPAEPAQTATNPPEQAAEVVVAGPEETQVEPVSVEPPAVEAEAAAATTPIDDADLAADPAAAQADLPDPPEVEGPADLALADAELPDATDDEVASPPVTTPVEPDPPPPPPPPPPTPEPPPREPAPVPDVSFFDDLLDQVK
jgi:hypothetical protein